MPTTTETKPKSGTCEYHRWYRQQKKEFDPEYHNRQLQLQRIRTKKRYAEIKDTVTEKERQKKYYQEIVKPRKLALKKQKEGLQSD